MAVRQYIGARYVTKIYENSLDPSSAEWEAGVAYEPLTMVTYNNSSYLSKKTVPASIGNPAANATYWIVTGAYNGQILALENKINNLIYINVLNPPSGCPSLDPTNTNDNTADLQGIINFIYQLKADTGIIGACIYFPRGTYKINGTVDVNTAHIRFLGEENGGTRFECDTTDPAGLDMFYVHANFIEFEQIAFWIMGDNTYVNTFIHSASGTRKVSINDCMFYDAKYALVFEDSPGVRAQNATVAFNVITYTDPIGFNFKGLCNSSYLLNCVGSMKGSTGTALKLEGTPNDFYLEHFESSRGADGCEITSDTSTKCIDIQLIDCVFDEPNRYGLYIHNLNSESEVSVIGGCIIPKTNGSKGVRIENCKNIKIEGLKVLNTSTHNLTNVDGVSLSAIVENILITGCNFYDMIRSLICTPGGSNVFKNVIFNNNLIVNENQTGGTTYVSKTKGGSVSNNSYRGNITQAMNIDSSSSNVMCVGNVGLTTSSVTNSYLGTYSPTGFEPTLTNSFIVD